MWMEVSMTQLKMGLVVPVDSTDAQREGARFAAARVTS